jgi:hypothetical protein
MRVALRVTGAHANITEGDAVLLTEIVIATTSDARNTLACAESSAVLRAHALLRLEFARALDQVRYAVLACWLCDAVMRTRATLWTSEQDPTDVSAALLDAGPAIWGPGEDMAPLQLHELAKLAPLSRPRRDSPNGRPPGSARHRPTSSEYGQIHCWPR